MSAEFGWISLRVRAPAQSKAVLQPLPSKHGGRNGCLTQGIQPTSVNVGLKSHQLQFKLWKFLNIQHLTVDLQALLY